jgi:glycosyltransferase involved in cell wall biosynthesis
MEQVLRDQADFGEKLHLIRPGVKVEKFSFRHDRYGYNIAMITGDIWVMKNVIEGLMIFATLVARNPCLPWKLHWRGQYADHARYMQVAVEHFLKSRGLEDRVTLYPPVSSIDEWLEPMDFILHPSIKEAFCYSVAEAMCKGIKPVLNDWLGCRDTWPQENIYKTVDEAIDIFLGPRTPEIYRRFVETCYPLERMVDNYDRLLGT